MIQFIGLIIAGYSSVRMIDILVDKQRETLIKIFAAVNLIATLFFALMLMASGAHISSLSQ
jgi:hypothetical protein